MFAKSDRDWPDRAWFMEGGNFGNDIHHVKCAVRGLERWIDNLSLELGQICIACRENK